jgi:hypothetical protein
VVSESDASEDEGGWGHAHAGAHFRRRGRAPITGVYVPSGHAPWERDMYASVSRRRSQGSASVSSAGTGGGRGLTTAEREKKNPRGDEPSNPGSLPGSHPSIRPESARDVRVSGGGAMSVGGSSATTTPRSSVANTPLTTPRSAKSDRGANPDVVASPKNRAAR